MTTQEQKRLEQLAKRDRVAWERVERETVAANERRTELIAAARTLHADGVSYATLADLLGLSKARVAQLLTR